jgi:hypothetical protein
MKTHHLPKSHKSHHKAPEPETQAKPEPRALVPLTRAILDTWGWGQIVEYCDLATPGIDPASLLTLSVHDICKHLRNKLTGDNHVQRITPRSNGSQAADWEEDDRAEQSRPNPPSPAYHDEMGQGRVPLNRVMDRSKLVH